MQQRLFKIASKIIEDEIKSFTMTEDQWKRYNLLHPNAKKENHTIIPDNFESESGKIRMSDEQYELEEKAKGNPSERYNVARNEKTHWSTLHKMSKDKNWQVRRAVAQSKNTRSLTLHKLADDPDKEVRLAVAMNKKTSFRTLRKMSKDSDREVREAVKRHKKSTDRIREKIDNRKPESTINFLSRHK
jgi:hypothetical protein